MKRGTKQSFSFFPDSLFLSGRGVSQRIWRDTSILRRLSRSSGRSVPLRRPLLTNRSGVFPHLCLMGMFLKRQRK